MQLGQREMKDDSAHLGDNFLTMLRNDKMTPYTSFTSSSNGRVFDFGASGCAWTTAEASATTRPVVEERVFRGLDKAELCVVDVSTACGATARETAMGTPPPSTAGFKGFVRCQSW